MSGRRLLVAGALAGAVAGALAAPGGAWAQARPTALADAGAPVRVVGTPRALVTVAVPVPAALDGQAVEFTVASASGVRVLGARAGRLAPDAPRRLVLTVNVPAGADAGLLPAATVTFAAAGRAVGVPVEVDVAPVRRVRVAVERGEQGVAAGDRLEVAYTVRNDGNRPDTVDVGVVLPAGWRLVDGAPPHPLAARSGGEGRLRVQAARQASGSYTLLLHAAGAGGAADSARLSVSVVGADDPAARGAGPELTLGVSVGDATGAPVMGYDVALGGPISDDLRVSGRGAFVPRQHALARGIGRLGMADVPPSFAVQGSRFALEVGTTSAQLSELGGMAAGGTGGSAAIAVGRVRTSAFWLDGGPGLDGRKAGGRVGVGVGAGELFATAARLDDGPLSGRRLDAGGLGLALPLLGGTMTGEGALRRHAAGEGIGWLARYDRQGDRLFLNAQAAHAPGGSAAFARAAREAALGTGVRLTPWLSVDAAGWATRDDAVGALGGVETHGGTGGVRVMLPAGFSTQLGVRAFDYATRSPLGRFGTGERSLSAHLGWRGGPAAVGVSVLEGERSRTTLALDAPGAAPALRGARGEYRLDGSVRLPRAAMLTVNAEVERNEAGSGLPPRQGIVRAALSGVELLRAGRVRVTGEGTWQRTSTFDAFRDQDLYRLGAVVELPGALRLRADALYNPYFASTGSPWLTTVHLLKSLRLPRVVPAGEAGVVYRDANGNGRRDAGEPGVAGVLVARGAERTVTGDDGRFDWRSAGREASAVEPRSIPDGWLPGPRRGRGRTVELPLVPISPLVVRLVLDTRDAARVPIAALGAVVVGARSADGRAYVGRHAAPDSVVFDGLPPGRYTLELDASGAVEPLRATGDLPTVEVGGGALAPVTLELRGRPLNIRRREASAPPASPATP